MPTLTGKGKRRKLGAPALLGASDAIESLGPRPSSVPQKRLGVAWTSPEGGAGLCSPRPMKARALPYYRFYVIDFRASRRVQALTYIERGLYRDLIDECWLRGGIPDNVPALAAICLCPVGVMQKAWPKLAGFFSPMDGHDGVLSSERLEIERTETDSRRTQASLAGKRSVNARQRVANAPSTTVERPSTSSSSSSSSSKAKQSSSRAAPLVTQEGELPPPTAVVQRLPRRAEDWRKLLDDGK